MPFLFHAQKYVDVNFDVKSYSACAALMQIITPMKLTKWKAESASTIPRGVPIQAIATTSAIIKQALTLIVGAFFIVSKQGLLIDVHP